MRWLASIGETALQRASSVLRILAIVGAVCAVAVKPRYWTRPVRNVLARQILFTGIEALPFTILLACLVGVTIVSQVQFWLVQIGQSELLGPMLATLVIREIAPVLASFIIIGRSATAIATELGNMQVDGQVRVLDAQGLDPFVYLVFPRVLGLALSVFSLAVLFVVVSLACGFVGGVLMKASTGIPSVFVSSVVEAVRPADIVNITVKSILPGLLTGSICCYEGLRVERVVTEVPQATTRAVVRSVGALFFVIAAVSLVTYL